MKMRGYPKMYASIHLAGSLPKSVVSPTSAPPGGVFQRHKSTLETWPKLNLLAMTLRWMGIDPSWMRLLTDHFYELQTLTHTYIYIVYIYIIYILTYNNHLTNRHITHHHITNHQVRLHYSTLHNLHDTSPHDTAPTHTHTRLNHTTRLHSLYTNHTLLLIP